MSKVVVEANGGMKGDGDKPLWNLVYWPLLMAFVRVLTFGATKYSPNNWQKVSRERIEAAVMRHWTEYLTSSKTDSETKESHLAHIMCCLMFLQWKDDNES